MLQRLNILFNVNHGVACSTLRLEFPESTPPHDDHSVQDQKEQDDQQKHYEKHEQHYQPEQQKHYEQQQQQRQHEHHEQHEQHNRCKRNDQNEWQRQYEQQEQHDQQQKQRLQPPEEEQTPRIQELHIPSRTPHEVFFGGRQNAIILFTASMALLASSLPVNIYYPSLIAIEKEFSTAATLVNLGVFGYRAVEVFSPMCRGRSSDRWGQHQAFVATIAIFIAAYAGITVSPTIAALFIIRLAQAFGTSSATMVDNELISDASVPTTSRTGYQAYYLLGYRTCIIVGPILGGAVAQYFSWRRTSCVLFCLSIAVLTMMIMFFSKTIRALVDNFYKSITLQWIQRRRQRRQYTKDPNYSNSVSIECDTPTTSASNTTMGTKTCLTQITHSREFYKHLLIPDFTLAIVISGFYFGTQCCFLINIPYVLADYYHLNVQEIGLCYLAQTGGSIVGGISVGHYLNYVFRKAALQCDATLGKEKKLTAIKSESLDLPTYRIRMGCVWGHVIAAHIITMLYGWNFVINMHVVVPLIVQFFVSVNIAFVNSAARLLLVDLRPVKGASVAATVRLVRQAFAVIGAFIMYPLTHVIGPGWTYTLLGVVLITSNVIIFMSVTYAFR